jgi:hypothetical protein
VLVGVGVGVIVGVDVGLGVAVGVVVGEAVGVGVAVAVAVALGVTVGVGVGVVPASSSNEPLSMRSFTTRSKPGPALIKERRWGEVGIASVNGRTARQQRVGKRWAAVILQGTEHRIGTDLVA